MRIRLLIAVLGALMVAACSSSGDDTTQPTLTVPGQTAAPTASGITSPTVDASDPVAVALASSGEMLPTQPMAEKTLFYAFKEGRHVTVMKREVSAGTERLVLEYDEPHEAALDGNYWNQLIPSIALDAAGGRLLYASDPDVMALDLQAGTSTPILQRPTVTSTGELARPAWTTPTGIELCCAYTLASLSVGPAGRAVAQMSQFEGSTLASFATDGSDACQVADLTAPYLSGGAVTWNGLGDAAAANVGGYSTPGIFLFSSVEPCVATILTTESVSYQDAAWSFDNQSLAAAKQSGESASAIVVIGKDGATEEVLVDDGGINFAPLFTPDGSEIYYVHAISTTADGRVGTWGVSVLERETQSVREVLSLPEGWLARPSGWTEEGHLILKLTFGCEAFLSCGSRLAVLDVDSGALIYVSSRRDFTNFLGFVP